MPVAPSAPPPPDDFQRPAASSLVVVLPYAPRVEYLTGISPPPHGRRWDSEDAPPPTYEEAVSLHM